MPKQKVPHQQMSFGLTRPCDACPFARRVYRPNAVRYLGKQRAEQIVQNLLEGNTFACHKTVRYDDNGEQVRGVHEQFCAGAILMLENTAGNWAHSVALVLAFALKWLTFDTLTQLFRHRAEVFDSWQAWINSQSEDHDAVE